MLGFGPRLGGRRWFGCRIGSGFDLGLHRRLGSSLRFRGRLRGRLRWSLWFRFRFRY